MDLVKLFYSVRYTRLDQLVARFKLLVKRKFSERVAGYLNKRFEQQDVKTATAYDIPSPIFHKRTSFFKITNENKQRFNLTFLNETHEFEFPINWHPAKLEYGTRLWKLNLHYHEFLEEVNDEWFEEIILDWIYQNPPYKNGYWLDSWNSFSLSIRVVVWMQQIQIRQEDLSESFLQKSSASLYKQLKFLYHNVENDIRGNHIIKNIKALLWGGSFFNGNRTAEKWTNKGKDLLERELDEQILEDGFHFERSPAYHGQVFADLLECYHVLDNDSLNIKLELVLKSMADVLHQVTHPDGKYSLFNDGGLEMSYSPIELIQQYEKAFETKIDTTQEIDLSKAGYFGLKKEKDLFLYDAGKIAPDTLPAHGQGDIFSFEWTIDGQRVFIDKGVYEYNAGQRRTESRSTLSHNTVNIDNEDQCEFWGAFRVARRADVEVIEKQINEDFLYIKAKHTGYTRLSGNPVHQRSVKFTRNELFLEDEAIGGDGQAVQARFLIHPNVKVTKDQNSVRLEFSKNSMKLETNGEVEVVESAWFPNFGVEEKCQQIIVLYGDCPTKNYCKFLIG